MKAAHEAIGRAVLAAQLFETTLVICFQIFKISIEPDYAEKTNRRIPVDAWKVPITAMVNELAKKMHIAADLEQRLRDYAEDRHTLIHRWTLSHGMPDGDDDEQWYELIRRLADKVTGEAYALMGMFCGYILANFNPDAPDADGTRQRQLVSELFKTVHKARDVHSS